jgi:hypothetical protein
MRQAAAGAKHLAEAQMHHDAKRAFETGVTVSYARAFTRQGIGQLDPDAWAPDDDC